MMLIRTQIPIAVTAKPHPRGLIPTLNRPRILENWPGSEAMARNAKTAMPAKIAKPIRINGEVMAPVIPDLATAPMPCGTIDGVLSQISHANQRPR